MDENRSSISHARSYEEMSEFWDDKDLADYDIEPAEFEVNIQSSKIYYSIDYTLSKKVAELARQRGVPAGTLLNLLLLERLHELEPAPPAPIPAQDGPQSAAA
jgi:hypothetical protein